MRWYITDHFKDMEETMAKAFHRYDIVDEEGGLIAENVGERDAREIIRNHNESEATS